MPITAGRVRRTSRLRSSRRSASPGCVRCPELRPPGRDVARKMEMRTRCRMSGSAGQTRCREEWSRLAAPIQIMQPPARYVDEAFRGFERFAGFMSPFCKLLRTFVTTIQPCAGSGFNRILRVGPMLGNRSLMLGGRQASHGAG
jgi:hypothetical protein